MRTVQVYGAKDFKIEVPDEAELTFGPFSPPGTGGGYRSGTPYGTLRVYRKIGKAKQIIGCFSQVTSFHDVEVQMVVQKTEQQKDAEERALIAAELQQQMAEAEAERLRRRNMKNGVVDDDF